MAVRLPSRYEDLDDAFRGRLRPDPELIALVQAANTSMQISGGIRFMPIFGKSGSGKSCAVRELATHLPGCAVVELSRNAIESESALLAELASASTRRHRPELVIAVVDQYEERVARQTDIPSQFVERLSLMDRGSLRDTPTLFLWLTTSREFQAELAAATSRNERLLTVGDFELVGPPPESWPAIVEETFAFHNRDQPLADFEILGADIERIGDASQTIGQTIERVGEKLSTSVSGLTDLSQYQVVMLWPVTDALRITRVSGFTGAREGYRLDWNAFYRDLTAEDKANVGNLAAYNRARLYFDVRLVPIAAADLMPLCRNLATDDEPLGQSYIGRFAKTHLVSLVAETWNPANFSPLRERESQRAEEARTWYAGVTSQPVALGKRLARIFRDLGYDASHEATLKAGRRNVRTDVLVRRSGAQQEAVCLELKAFSTEGTRPSSIRDAIRGTLRKYAQFAGFIEGD